MDLLVYLQIGYPRPVPEILVDSKMTLWVSSFVAPKYYRRKSPLSPNTARWPCSWPPQLALRSGIMPDSPNTKRVRMRVKRDALRAEVKQREHAKMRAALPASLQGVVPVTTSPWKKKKSGRPRIEQLQMQQAHDDRLLLDNIT